MKYRLLAILMLVGVFAALPVDAVGEKDANSRSRYLAGQFLVATPKIVDPRFKETIIYMIDHDAEGAMGFVVNRPFGSGRLSDLMKGFGVKEHVNDDVDGDVSLFYGGPVEGVRGFVLHSSDYTDEGTAFVNGQVALTSRVDILLAIAKGKGPKHSLFLLGYAGWGPGQLEKEMARDDWFTSSVDLEIMFSDDPASAWKKISKVSGVEL